MLKHLFAGSLLLAAGLAAGCKKDAAAPGAGGPQNYAVQAVVVPARIQTVSETLSLVGTLAANEMIEVKCEADGTIEEILFEEGGPVKKGDLLVRLDESKFSSAVEEAEANFKLSRATHERSRQLHLEKLISQQEFEQVAALFQANQAGLDLKRRQLKDARIYAPFDGIVSSRPVSPGQVISKNTTLTWLVDLDPVKAEVNVPERFLSQVRVGQSIDLTVAAYPGRKFTGQVFFIAPFIEPATRTALVKATIPNPQNELKPGMFANLDLTLKLKDHAVVVPESAILPSGDRNVLYVVDANDTAQIRPVKLGLRQAGMVEIVSGLKGGERVVSEGIQKVRPGGKVKAAAATTELPPAKRTETNAPAARPRDKSAVQRSGAEAGAA